MTPQEQKTKIVNQFKQLWYYAGEWHDAECPFILHDTGVCSCKVAKNRKAILQALQPETEKSPEEELEEIEEISVMAGGTATKTINQLVRAIKQLQRERK